MVHIVPPAGWLDNAQTSAATEVTQPAPSESHQPPHNVAPHAASPAENIAANEPAAVEETASTVDAGPEFGEFDPGDLQSAPPDYPATPLSATAPAELWWRRFAIITTSGGVGLFLLGSLVGALLTRDSDAPTAQPREVTQQASDEFAAKAAEESIEVADEGASPSMAGEVITADVVPANSVAEPYQSHEVELASATVDVAVDRQASPGTDDPTSAEGRGDDLSTQTAESPTTTGDGEDSTQSTGEPSRRVMRFDPLAYDPANLHLALTLDSVNRPTAGTNAKSPADAQSEKYVEPPEQPATSEEPSASRPDPRAPLRLGPAPATTQAALDVESQLALPLEAIDIPRLSLANWLAMVTEMTNVPVQLDPAALWMLGISATRPVSIQAQHTTAGELLDKTLAPHKLQAVRHPTGVVVTRQATDDSVRSAPYEVSDLTKNDPAALEHLETMVREMIAPDSWQPGGIGKLETQPGKLLVEHQLPERLQILILLDRLRMARGLPPASRYPQSRLTTEPTYAALEPSLSNQATFTFLEWSPLADVFRFWQTEMGLTVLVDWQALSELDLAPTTPVAASIIDRPWYEALDATLSQINLTWHAIDAQTIEISTHTALADTASIEFYPVSKLLQDRFADVGALENSLRDAVESQVGTLVAEQVRFVYDSSSGQLLVRAPGNAQRAIHEHLRSDQLSVAAR